MTKKIRINNVRLSFEHIFKPSSFDDGQDPKYSADLIVPKDHPDLPAVKKAFFEAGREKFPSDFKGTGWPRGYTCSLKDADVDTDNSGTVLSEKYPEYKGCYILKANSTKRPTVVNRNGKTPIIETDGIIYSGCWVNVNLGIGGFTFGKMTKGVKAYLNGVQFVEDGEPLSGAVDSFEALDGDDEDFCS